MASANSDTGISPSNTQNSHGTILSELSDKSMSSIKTMIIEALSAFDSKQQERHKVIENNITANATAISSVNSQIEVLNNRLAAAENENLRLQQLIDKKISESSVKIKTHVDKSDSYRKNDRKLTDFLMFQLNLREQRSRQRTLRVFNFQAGEAAVSSQSIFELLLKPTLLLAKQQNKLRFVPDNLDELCETAHEVPKRNQPDEYLFVFYSRFALNAFLEFKFDVIKELNSKSALDSNPSYAGVLKHHTDRPIRASRDLSPLNRRIMWRLYKNPLIKSCKIRRLSVAFKLVNSTEWFDVVNPYASTLVGLTVPIPVDKIMAAERNPLIFEESDDAVNTSVVDTSEVPATSRRGSAAAVSVPVGVAAAVAAAMTGPPESAPGFVPGPDVTPELGGVAAAVAAAMTGPPESVPGPAVTSVSEGAAAAVAAALSGPQESVGAPTDVVDPATAVEAADLADAIRAAQSSQKRPAGFSPADKPAPKKGSLAYIQQSPPLTTNERRSQRAKSKKSPKKKFYQ